MRALSLKQPWASLVAYGSKRIETRSWRTKYRGVLAIHASSGLGPEADSLIHNAIFLRQGITQLPTGVLIATCMLVDVQPITRGLTDLLSAEELLYGDYQEGRYAWLLEDVKILAAPIPMRGHLGLWTVDSHWPDEISFVKHS